MEITRHPIAVPSICLWNWPLKEKYVLYRQNPNNSIILCTDNTVLSCNEVSCSSRPCVILSAGSTGTDVHSAVTTIKNILGKHKDKDPLDTKVEPSIGISVGNSCVMKNM